MRDLTALQSQQQIIGAVCMYGLTPDMLDVLEQLPEQAFTDPLMLRCYKFAIKCSRNGDPCDHGTIMMSLDNGDEIATIAALTSSTVNANVKAHAKTAAIPRQAHSRLRCPCRNMTGEMLPNKYAELAIKPERLGALFRSTQGASPCGLLSLRAEEAAGVPDV